MADKVIDFAKEYRKRYDAAKAAWERVAPLTMVFVSQDFFFMSNGDVRKIEWSNQEDVTKW